MLYDRISWRVSGDINIEPYCFVYVLYVDLTREDICVLSNNTSN